MEILILLVKISDAILIIMLGAFIYDKIKNHSNGDKSDSNK